MLPDGPRGVRLAPGTVTITDGRISGVVEGEPGAVPDLGGEGCLIAPGFVDTHVHLPQFDSIGVAGLELLDWLDRVIFPAEARWADADFAGQMAGRVARELLSFGTTAVAAYATVHHRAAVAAMEALAGAGLKGVVGQVLMDRNAPPELIRPAEQLLREAAALTPMGTIAPAVTPRFAVSCSDELLRGAGTLAAATGSFIQTHLAETRRELATIAQLFGGLAYTEVYRRAGLLSGRCLLGHGIHLDGSDHAAITGAGATIAHCPTANRFLAAGTMDRSAALSRGVAVSLGSDVAGGPDRSMVRVARAMAEAAAALGQTPIPAAECWWQITAGNAGALRLSGTGTIATGAAADLVIARPTLGPGGVGRASAGTLSAVLYGWDDRWIERTLVDGRIVFDSAAPARRA